MKEFNRQFYGDNYYTIDTLNNAIDRKTESNNTIDRIRFKNANYCTEPGILSLRMKQEDLDRRLWRFYYEHPEGRENRIPVVVQDALDRTSYSVIAICVKRYYNKDSFDPFWDEEATEKVLKPFMEEFGYVGP